MVLHGNHLPGVFNPSLSAWFLNFLFTSQKTSRQQNTICISVLPVMGVWRPKKPSGRAQRLLGLHRAQLHLLFVPADDSHRSFLHLSSYSWNIWSRGVFIRFDRWPLVWPHTNSTEELPSNKIFLHSLLPCSVVKTLISSCHE